MTRPATPARRRALVAIAAAPWFARVAPAQTAAPAEVAAELAGARLSGSGRLTFLLLHVYDARLWVRDPFSAEQALAAPLALELEYARALVGRLIAERSLEEMRRVPGIAEPDAERWLAWMSRVFPDVARGDRITGVHRPGEAARIFVNGALRGELREPEFARRFFGIWLGPQTSEPALRSQLLGTTKAAS